MLRYPTLVQPRRDDKRLASSIDLAPTILAACGMEATDTMLGINLLDDSAVTDRQRIEGEIYAHDVADVQNPAASLKYRWVIEGPWKLIQPQASSESLELYHLVDDPHEEKNLAAIHPDRARQLSPN